MLKRFSALFIVSAMLLAGCEQMDQSMQYSRYQANERGERTLIVYLAMNNNLATYAYDNIGGLLAGATPASLSGGRILVYRTIPNRPPALIEIKATSNGSYADTLKIYPLQNSVRTDVFRQVLDDAKALAPARTYGLDIGSHSSGWLPPAGVLAAGAGRLKAQQQPEEAGWAHPEGGPLTRVLMQEILANDAMTLKDFAQTVHDGEFEYIMFDACYNGQVEVAYELRNKAQWLIASPAEIVAQGMPYRQIVEDLMAPTPRLANVCRKFYEFYNSQDFGWKQTATIALYDCSKMDALAAAFKPIATTYRTQISAMSTSSIQYFDRYSPTSMFDMVDFVKTLIPSSIDPLRTAFEQALDQVILYKNSTPYIMHGDTGWIKVKTFCGMTSYIPTDAMTAARNNYYYANTSWGHYIYQ